jgi:F-type H+-transporting ATPase subunit delta
MHHSRAAIRYATALIGVAVDRNELDAVAADVGSLERTIAGSPDFAAFLRSPVINKERKRKALREILAGRTGETLAAFCILLASKARESLLPEILGQFLRLRDERLGIMNVTARSAAEFSPEQQARLGERIGAVTGKKVRLKVERDPALIGGFTVQYEDTVWDSSVKRQLELLRERLVAGV